jgi:hypothetical protein
MSDEIDEKELPEEGNSNARLYPPVEQADAEEAEQDPGQPASGDAAAEREGTPEPSE